MAEIQQSGRVRGGREREHDKERAYFLALLLLSKMKFSCNECCYGKVVPIYWNFPSSHAVPHDGNPDHMRLGFKDKKAGD